MNNKAIYKKTIGFSIRRALWDLLAAAVFIASLVLGFIILDKTTNMGILGLGIGAIVGGILIHFILRYVGYTYKAGQIAMMTKGVSEGKLPDDVIGAGKKIVKERFTTVAVYFAATGVIKGIFRQIGNGITAISKSVGGDTGNAVGSTISAVIETIVSYLCDCCLGWVFYQENERASKATLEGAVIFFKNGKTFIRNMGRVFGMSFLSFLVIGGVFFGISWLILQAFPDMMAGLSTEIIEAGGRTGANLPGWISDIGTLTIVCSVVIGVVIWGILHSTFVRPFILVGVLRNYIKSGKENRPTEQAFSELDEKSKKFKELHEKVEAGE